MSEIEREHTCENCYYEEVDGYAYPCNRCSHNKPTDDMWRQRSMSEWIPVNERLPEIGQKVLVSTKRTVFTQVFKGVYSEPNVWHWEHNSIKEITAWMPLPEPYKE